MSQKPSYIYVVFTQDGFNTVIGAFSTKARALAYIATSEEDLYVQEYRSSSICMSKN